jgi:hypothetical protein
MKEDIQQLIEFVEQLHLNDHIKVEDAKVLPGYKKDELDELAQGLEVEFNNDLYKFFSVAGDISLLWSAKNPDEIKEEDFGYVIGSIQILNPFEMIMGKTGTKWKDVLWFDHMDEREKAEYKSFVPFDFPTTELIAGFKLREGKLSNDMFLLNINEGITPLNIRLDKYVKYLIQNKGFMYWQSFLKDNDSLEYKRYLHYTAILFSDKDHDFAHN